MSKKNEKGAWVIPEKDLEEFGFYDSKRKVNYRKYVTDAYFSLFPLTQKKQIKNKIKYNNKN